MLQARVRAICVVPGPQTRVVPEISEVMVGSGGFWEFRNLGFLLFLKAAWREAGPSAHSPRLPWGTEPSLVVPWRNENKGAFLLADSGARLRYGGGSILQVASA